VTMMDTTSDGEPYRLVSNQKQAKKPRTNHEEPEEPENLNETLLCITFKKPLKRGTEINVTATVKQLFSTMKSADPRLTVLALDRQASFRPNNDEFPTTEDKFKKFYLVHPRSNNPVYKNHVTIGCILRTSKTIANLKESDVNNIKLLDWLTVFKIFLEADTLGHDITKVIGFLLHVHPRVVHRDALKEVLTSKLQELTIDPKQVIALDPTAADHYQHAMDSGDHLDTYVPPFEIFSTVISNTHESKHVNTRAIGIKCAARHHALFRELFSQLFTTPPTKLAHIQFSLSGILTVIGAAAFQNLIRDNNKHFDNLATIPLAGITNDHLDLDIPVADPKDPNHRMTIRKIILANEWCSTIETTHTNGRLLLTTTKHNLAEARQRIDQNMEPLFTHFLPKNPRFAPHSNYPIPRRTDRISINTTTKQYAAKLVNSIPNYGTTGKDKDKFSKFPTKHQDKNPKYIYSEQNFPTLKKPPTPQNTPDSNIQQPASKTPNTKNTQPTPGTPTFQPKQPFDLQALKAQIQKNLETDFTKLINAKIDDFHSEIRHTMKKMETSYDELSTAVKMLTEQQQRMHVTLESLQNNITNHPSPSNRGDGRI